MLRSVFRTVGPGLNAIGVRLEAAGRKVGADYPYPAYAATREVPFEVDLHNYLTHWLSPHVQGAKAPSAMDELLDGKQASEVVPVTGAFVAPTASVQASEVKLEEGAGVWYHAVVSGNVTVGKDANVLEHASVAGSKAKPTTVGAFATVAAHAKVAEGVTLGARSVVAAGAVVDAGVVVESDGVVGPGAHVASGSVVKSKEFWAGSPAVLIRSLAPDEMANFAADAVATAKLAKIHAHEHGKDVIVVHSERQAFLDRGSFVETAYMDAKDPGELYQNIGNATRPDVAGRGLFFDTKAQ